MATSYLTLDQLLAVQFDRPTNLLLSAAAGSGKTTTLTERIVDRMLKGAVLPSELLVITFTELAAKDLKVKIERRLHEARDRAGSKEEKLFSDRLLNELSLAQISTIHAFCQQILNAYLPEFADEEGKALLEPGFRVMDDEEEQKLRDDSLDTVLRTLYRRISEPEFFEPFILAGEKRSCDDWLLDFQTVARAYSPDLDDKVFREAILDMLELLRNLPRYEEQAATSLETLFHRAQHFPSPDDRAVSYWWDLYEESLDSARRSLREMNDDPFLNDVLRTSKLKTELQLAQAVETATDVVEALTGLSGRDAEHWDAVHAVGQAIDDIRLPAFSGGENLSEKNEEKNRWIEQYRQTILPLLALLSDRIKRTGRDADVVVNHPPVFSASASQIRQALIRTCQPVARFMEIVLLTDQEFKKRRFQRNAIQFSDMEHSALKLLNDPHIQQDYRSRFKEVYVDEYQDTSSIQDAIIEKVSDRNRLAVGDIKQSIYRFRYANPQLFSHHEKHSRTITAGEDIPPLQPGELGYLALLNRCFRTRPKIIDFINDFFNSFLTEASGEIEYDETQQLIADDNKWKKIEETETPGKNRTPAVETVLHVATSVANQYLPEDDEAIDEDLVAISPLRPAAREAFMAVDIIRELTVKGVKHEQIAILLPTNDDCRQYEEILALSGIPVTTRSGRSFADSFVFSQAEALLSLLDNPRQDVPLLSMLIGPFSPEIWTAKELMEAARTPIALPSDKKKAYDIHFHDRFFTLCESGEGALSDKARGFIDVIERWRFLSHELDPKELLELIFYETDYAYYLAQSKFGESYLSELDRLLDCLSAPERFSQTGIRTALSTLQHCEENQRAPSDTALLPRAVRVLTRHRSKGLEWDYVILGQLDAAWKLLDQRPIIYYTEAEGLTSATIEEQGMAVMNNPLHQATLLAEERRARAESWRLLYVAMTRAIHGLYLLLSTDRPTLGDSSRYQTLLKNIERHTGGLGYDERKKRAIIPPVLSASTKSDADLLLMYLAARYPDTAEQLLSFESGRMALHPFESIVVTDWHDIVRKTLIQGEAPIDENQEEAIPFDREAIEETALELLTKPIPRPEAAITPSKITVTEMQRMGLETTIGLYEETTAESVHTVDPEDGTRVIRAEMPLTMRTREKAPADRGPSFGTTMHSVFRFLDLEKLCLGDPEEGAREYLAQLAKMCESHTLTKEEEKAASSLASQAVRWARSPLARRVMKVEQETKKLYREMPFTLAVPSNRFSSAFPQDETSLVQGMIDLWFVEEDGQAVLVDFKTDRLPFEKVEAILKERYRIQINAYQEAIERATGRMVKERYIWLIREGRAIAL